MGYVREYTGNIYLIYISLYLPTVYLIPCDFEDAAACGYNLVSPTVLIANPDGEWRRRGGYSHQIPPYDKTFGDDRGNILNSMIMEAMLNEG